MLPPASEEASFGRRNENLCARHCHSSETLEEFIPRIRNLPDFASHEEEEGLRPPFSSLFVRNIQSDNFTPHALREMNSAAVDRDRNSGATHASAGWRMRNG